MDRLLLFYNKLRLNILIVDYRGYGGSTGTPTEDGLARDAEAVLSFAVNCGHIDPHKLILFGKSLGGAVAINLAFRQQQHILALILENTFTHLGRVVDQHMPYLKWLKPVLLRNHWPSLNRIKSITIPILFIYSELDEVISNENSQDLYKAATSCAYKKIHMIADGDHNNSYKYNEASYIGHIVPLFLLLFRPAMRSAFYATEYWALLSDYALAHSGSLE